MARGHTLSLSESLSSRVGVTLLGEAARTRFLRCAHVAVQARNLVLPDLPRGSSERVVTQYPFRIFWHVHSLLTALLV